MEKIKLYTGELIYSLLGNITKDFGSVSFDTTETGGIKIRFIINNSTEFDMELINDIISEFEAMHGNIESLEWDVYQKHQGYQPLKNRIFERY